MMNKRFFICIPLLFILLLLPAAADSDNSLKNGISNEKVAELKKNLFILGYIDEANISDLFDDITEAAVKKFQVDYGITVDGIVNEETEKIIKIALIQDEIIKNGKPENNASVISDRGAIRRMTTIASKYAGVKYRRGGASPNGFDCSGLTQYVYNQLGISIERTSKDQFKQGAPIAKNDLLAGDLVFFRRSKNNASRIQHVGIYLGDNKFIHASSSKHKVVVADFNEYCKWSNYAGARRFVIK